MNIPVVLMTEEGPAGTVSMPCAPYPGLVITTTQAYVVDLVVYSAPLGAFVARVHLDGTEDLTRLLKKES